MAHRYRAGDDPEDIEYLVADYRWLRDEMRRRTKVIRDIADKYPERCPENKVTPELASDPRLGLHPIAIAVDECQVAFEHPAYGAEMATIATDLAKRGPALGIMQMLATQRPDAKSIPTGISRQRRAAVVPEGHGPDRERHGAGHVASTRPASGPPCSASTTRASSTSAARACGPRIMRGQHIDGPAAKVIVARARVMREAAGRITGYALGEDGDQEVRSFAADVLMVFGADDKLWCETIAARLAGSIPSAYADITKDAVASQLRALEVDVKSVRETGKGPRSGCERAAVAAAAPPPGA